MESDDNRRELETYGHHAFGRIRQLQMQGDDRAVGTIRTKTTNGYSISSPTLEHHANGKEYDGSRFGVLDPTVLCHLLCNLWTRIVGKRTTKCSLASSRSH